MQRREFLGWSAAALAGATLVEAKAPKALVVASANGLSATEKAMSLLRQGADVLDAVVAGVNIVEDDPEDITVGYGGLPNEDGEVELDASVMHGPTGRAGAVASLRYIKNPSKVARLVMERTDHLLLVGEGALKFALAHGFKREDLLTEKSRKIWLKWRESMSDKDSWGPGLASADKPIDPAIASIIADPPTGTINCLAIDSHGNISGVTTTSGLAFKMSGRVGDSPLIGCGLYVDNAVGAAGSTGRGEECIRVNGAHAVVEMMRRGASPVEACLEALKRVSANYGHNREKLRRFNLNFYALNKHGEHGAAALWSYRILEGKRVHSQYAVHDGQNSLKDSAYLYELD